MTDENNVNLTDVVKALSTPSAPASVSCSVVSLGIPPEATTVRVGTTVGGLKRQLGTDAKFVITDANGTREAFDSDVIVEGATYYKATGKKNG